MYYVTVVDTFLSGWGKAKGKQNILIFECKTREDSRIVKGNARARTDTGEIQLHSKYPHFPHESCYVQHYDKAVYPNWYKPNYFKKQVNRS